MTKSVLLIEDEPNIIEAISFILERDGWAVAVHQNGADAVAKALAVQPHVVILDAMLPGRSGFEILEEMRARPETSALPVLMLTARGQARDRAAAKAAGASRFMTKPFANSDVLEAVRALAG